MHEDSLNFSGLLILILLLPWCQGRKIWRSWLWGHYYVMYLPLKRVSKRDLPSFSSVHSVSLFLSPRTSLFFIPYSFLCHPAFLSLLSRIPFFVIPYLIRDPVTLCTTSAFFLIGDNGLPILPYYPLLDSGLRRICLEGCRISKYALS